MLEIRDLRKVAWRRLRGKQHYLGYLTLTDQAVRLSGHEQATGIDVTLSIPPAAIDRVRIGHTDERVAGERAIVVELVDSESVLVAPVDSTATDVDRLARRLAAAVDPPSGSAPGQSSSRRPLASA
jgi:hypothetical protein